MTARRRAARAGTRQGSRHDAARPRRYGDRWRLAVFLAVVALVKIAVAWQLRDHPLLSADAGLDTEAYLQLARRVMGGDALLGPGLYYLSPLYIYFLSAVMSVSDSLLFVRVVQACLGTLAVGCVFAATRVWFGRRAAWAAATLAALTGTLTFYEIVILQSSLDSALTAGSLALLAIALAEEGTAFDGEDWTTSRPRTRAAAAAGILFGLLILNRPNAIVAVAGIAAGLLIARRLRIAIAVLAGVLVALAPVVARNAIVSRQFALVSSQGGLNFYIGNSAAATGQYIEVPGVRANIQGQADDTKTVAERETGRPLSDAEVSRHFATKAFAWIRSSPSAAARLFARKLALVFNARHQWLDLSYPYYAYDTGSMLWLLFVGPWLLVPLGLAGLVAGFRRQSPGIDRASYAAWAAFVPLYAVGVAIFFVAERYRLPLLLPLCVCAGGALDSLAAREPLRQLISIGLAILAGTLLTAWPFQIPDGRFEERQKLAKVLMNRGDYDGAARELQAALARKPGDTGTEFALGMALVSAGRSGEGIQHVRHAVDAGVPVNGARYALANVLLRTGDAEGAVRLLRSYSPEPGDSAQSCFQVAMLAIDAGAPDVARRYLRRALELQPGWPEAVQALADLGGQR